MLNDLIISNIRKSLNIISQRGLSFSLNSGELNFLPSFDRNKIDGQIVCAQADYFGFYALRSALRGLGLSTNFLVAGQRTLSDDLYGPTVVSLYTAAYHVVESLLALSGRVWVNLQAHEDSSSATVPLIIVGCLTRDNSWIFENRRRTHLSRWKELRPILLDADPHLLQCFQDLFQHFFRGRYKSRTPLKLYLEALDSANPLPIGEPFSLREKVDEFLEMIAESRHTSHYGGFGSDPFAYEATINGELHNRKGMAARARAFEEFVRGVIDEMSTKLDEFLGELKLPETVKTALFLSVGFPWFDEPQYDLIQPKQLGVRLKRLFHSICDGQP